MTEFGVARGARTFALALLDRARREESIEGVVERRPVALVLDDGGGEPVAEALALHADRRGCAQRIDAFCQRDGHARRSDLVQELGESRSHGRQRRDAPSTDATFGSALRISSSCLRRRLSV